MYPGSKMPTFPGNFLQGKFLRITSLVKVASHGKFSVAIDKNRNFVAENIFSNGYKTLKNARNT